MSVQSAERLRQGHCKPCEGGVEKLGPAAAERQMAELSGWRLGDGSRSISKSLKQKDFAATIKLVNRIAEIAEVEQHHPDLHVTGYNKLEIVLMTHAIGGLSENDFILAAKIDELVG